MSDKRITAKRIPDSSIVGVGPTVIYDDDPDLYLYDLSKVVIKKRGATSTANYIASPPILDAAILGSTVNNATVVASDLSFENSIFNSDKVDLSYIETITPSSYDDSLGNKKVKYLIKIRNSSSNKNNIVGVDARIYNPFA
jgi:hypothetical protein